MRDRLDCHVYLGRVCVRVLCVLFENRGERDRELKKEREVSKSHGHGSMDQHK